MEPDTEDTFKSYHQVEKTTDRPLIRVMALRWEIDKILDDESELIFDAERR